MSNVSEARVGQGGDPNTPLTVLVGVVSAILLFVLVVFLQAFFYRQEQGEALRKVVAVAPEELSQLRAQQQELLHSYRYLDAQKGVVGIPIDRAMELVAKETSRDAPQAKRPSGSKGGLGTR